MIFARLAFVLLVVLFTAGCSSYETRWRAAADPKKSTVTRWDGQWKSAQHGKGATGRLRCIFERDGKTARAIFRANWLSFASTYTVPMQRQPRARSDRQAGEHYVGSHALPKIFGGLYRYDAWITRDRFFARYTSSADEGTFDMTRQLTSSAAIH